jgi:beta-aspartyl-peptidase (threonine type)
MIVVCSGPLGLEQAMDVLRAGGSALDAVEAGARHVEAHDTGHGVGLGGCPNLIGEVELDAGIMDGRTRAVGAVAAVRDFAHPISIARQVMERLPHVLLAGAGAERFGDEIGAERFPMLTPEMDQEWRKYLTNWAKVDPATIHSYPHLVELVRRAADERRPHGTVDFMAIDASGNMAIAVTTSGYPYKYPGRVGDSPICGAGYYVDNRYGAAGCIGLGELTIRAATARSAILFLQMGYSLEEAGRAAMRDLGPMIKAEGANILIHLLDPQGRAMGFSSGEGGNFYYMTPEMEHAAQQPRIAFAL